MQKHWIFATFALKNDLSSYKNSYCLIFCWLINQLMLQVQFTQLPLHSACLSCHTKQNILIYLANWQVLKQRWCLKRTILHLIIITYTLTLINTVFESTQIACTVKCRPILFTGSMQPLPTHHQNTAHASDRDPKPTAHDRRAASRRMGLNVCVCVCVWEE